MTDFELGAMKSILKIFPDIVTKTCTFHLGQNVYKRFVSFGLVLN